MHVIILQVITEFTMKILCSAKHGERKEQPIGGCSQERNKHIKSRKPKN